MRKRAILAWTTMLAACGAPADMDKVWTAVDHFRQQQAAGDDAGIYAAASPQLRAATSLTDLKRLDDVVRGAIARGCAAPPHDPTQWRINYGTGGEVVASSYTRSCADGDLVENFTFRIDHGEPLLEGYNVSGMALFPAQAPTPATPSTPTPPSAPPASGATPT